VSDRPCGVVPDRKQGSAVILGRGANWFLDPRFGLRVRIVAPMERRVAAVARELDLPSARAERRVRAYDAGQAAFIRQVFDHDIDDPLGYDLVLNLEALDLEPAVRIAISALRRELAPERTS
jgi:cytidylate kinase